jgi:hypothetical protein
LSTDGQLAGHHVGVDVVAFVVLAEADRADDRDELVVLQRLHHGRVDRHDIADLAHVVLDRRVLVVQHLQLLGADQAAVAAGQAHRLAAGLVDQAHDVLLHLAGQHPLDHLHGLGVGHAHALDELPFLPRRFSAVSICGPPPCTTTGFMPTSLSSTTSSAKSGLQRRVGHGVAAVLDDQGLAVELADVGQRLGQDLGLVARGDVGCGWRFLAG